MSKKNIYLLIILFLILNIFSLKSFYYNLSWDKLYKKWLYIDSANTFEKADNIDWIYNKANSLYKKNKYKEGIEEYLTIISEDKTTINYSINHNIWNSYYRIWELDNNKLDYWDKSVEYYNKALDIRYDDETKDNLDFVLKKIQEEKEKNNEEEEEKKEQQWDKSEESKEDEWKKWEENKKEETGSWSKSEENKKWEEWKEWDKSWDDKSWEKSESEKKEEWEWGTDNIEEGEWEKIEENKISESQETALKQYEQALKQAEQENQDWFNKVYEWNSNNDPFERLFNNSLLNDNSWEKDW